jgi:DnaJ-class molecular chaperone
MSHIEIRIKTDNSAFRPEATEESEGPLDTREVRDVLDKIGRKIEAGHKSGSVMDSNGATVAEFDVAEDFEECETCFGTGEVEAEIDGGDNTRPEDCPECGGKKVTPVERPVTA